MPARTWKPSGDAAAAHKDRPPSPSRQQATGRRTPGAPVAPPMAPRSLALPVLLACLLVLLVLADGARRADRGPWAWRRRCRALTAQRRLRHSSAKGHRAWTLRSWPVVRVKRVFRGGSRKQQQLDSNQVLGSSSSLADLCRTKATLRRSRVWRSGVRRPPRRDLGECVALAACCHFSRATLRKG